MKFGGSTSIVDVELAAGKTRFTMGGSIFQIDDGLLGYEADFGYVPGFFEGDRELVNPGSYVIDLTGSVLFALPPGMTGGGLRPYFAAGAGLVNVQASDFLDVLRVRRTVPAYKLGGGAIGMITNNVGLRFDFRHVRSFTTDDGSLAQVGRRINYSRFTVGLLLRL